jgi:hypothetical protein
LPSESRTLLRAALVPALVILGGALLGALAGVGWWAWWRPAPPGVVGGHHPYFLPDAEFRSTGLYVVIAAPLGLVMGLVGMWLLRRDRLLAVVIVLLAATVGGFAMLLTGGLLGPVDPLSIADTAKDGTLVHAALRVQPGAAWATMPFTAACACLAMLLLSDNSETREPALV